jgi:inner membrane protein
MPSSLSHAMVAVAAGAMLAPRTHLRPFLIIGAVCAVLPDIDAMGRTLPIAEGDLEFLGGHRGFTHSLTFAALTGVVVGSAALFRQSWNGHRLRLMIFIAFATAAHGALDALTSVGAATSPVQFFSPFSTQGYTSSWHPIHGPFGELLVCLLPLGLLTRYVWHARGLPKRARSIERPLTIGMRDDPGAFGTADPAAVRKWIYVALLAFLAFWGWRSEARLAETRESRPPVGILPATLTQNATVRIEKQ